MTVLPDPPPHDSRNREAMPHPQVLIPDLELGHLRVVEWQVAAPSSAEHDPRSTYVELFWLGILGPTAVWLMRHLARRLDEPPADDHDDAEHGVWIEIEETARAIGLASGRQRSAAFARTVDRLIRFNMATTVNGHTLAVRRQMPAISRRQVERLPSALQAAHQKWIGSSDTESRVA